ncbi:AsmA family protein [Kaistella palustris]|uniref:YtxH domain-containing protein n=1 Tax=Kaistella palustris TaxID=493376 RepID=UPI000426C44D|nr:YtxH domain-containing protein [Kaistella palustris]
MKKKYLRTFTVILGVTVLVIFAANVGLNFWLKHNLPRYIKNNSDYFITYKTLDVDLGTGNVNATGVTVNTQNPDRTDKLNLQGTVDTLIVSRLGIYDLIFHKKISTQDLTLKNPTLNIVLAKPATETGKPKKPVVLKNINISSGDIQIFRAAGQKLLSVKDLDLTLEKLQMTEKAEGEKLPFTFEKYSLKGNNFFFRPDNVYAFTAKSVTTENGQMKVEKFAINPLLSYRNFLKYYPKKRNLFDVSAAEMRFKDIIIKNNQLSLSDLQLQDPDITFYTNDVKSNEKKKSFTYNIDLENVLLSNAKISILKSAGNPLFTAGNLTLQINRLVMNDETAKGNIPFKYENFNIEGKNLTYLSATQNVKVAAVALQPKSAKLEKITVQPHGASADKTSLDLSVNRLDLKINDWQFNNNKLKLNLQNVLLTGLKGTVRPAENSAKQKPIFAGIQFPLLIKNVAVKNSDLIIESKNQPLILKNLNANFQDIEMNAQTIKSRLPFKTGNYTLTTRNFTYKTKFYNFAASLLKLNKNAAQVSGFSMKPTVSRAQFIRMIPAEKDLYDIKVSEIAMKGKWDLISESKFLDVSQVTLNGVNANIFRSKIPKDDLSEKPLYSKLLRSVKFPMFIGNLDINNSLLVYEEDTKKSDGPGKLVFDQFTLNAKNINSGKMKGKPTEIPISIACRFMNASPMKVSWRMNTARPDDAFTISGNVSDLPASRVNPFIEPYLKIRATGLISDLIFNFNGNNAGIQGSLNMKHKELQIAVLKDDGEKNQLLSAVANIFVRTDSGSYPESVSVENVERDKTKSFFNLFWRGIEQGLKKTLIGKNAPKTEEKVRATVDNTKAALQENKKDLQETKGQVQEKVETIKEKAQDKKENIKKKGIFRKIFKKKSDS